MNSLKLPKAIWVKLVTIAAESGMTPSQLVAFWAANFRWDDQRCLIGRTNDESQKIRAIVQEPFRAFPEGGLDCQKDTFSPQAGATIMEFSRRTKGTRHGEGHGSGKGEG